MLLLLARVASAATVAVVDFDGYGVAFSDAQTATQGVRDAFLEAGTLDPLSGSDIADGVSKGKDDALRRARELVAEGRRRYTTGDAAGALGPLEEAIGLHEDAFSDVGRRPELADAVFLHGLCLLTTGRATEAKARFGEAAALVPQYAQERGTRMPSEAATILFSVEDALARGPKQARSAAEVGRIADALDVDYVVTGWVAGDGALSAKLYAGGELVSEAKVMLEERPPLPVDAGYNALVTALTRGGLSAPVAGAAPAGSVVDEPADDSADEALSEEEAALLEEDTPDLGDGRSATRGASGEGATMLKIKTAGPMRTPKPIVERWWFWTGAVAVAGGGAFGAWYALTPPPVVYEEEPDGWSVTVRTE